MGCATRLGETAEEPIALSNKFTPTSGFVGRQREMEQLTAALEDARAGRGRLVMLAGEPGIGKTRIAQELAAYAETRGFQVLWGRCYEGEGAPPKLDQVVNFYSTKEL